MGIVFGRERNGLTTEEIALVRAMYVCMYVYVCIYFMYVCMYVCVCIYFMYVCMYLVHNWFFEHHYYLLTPTRP